jgi:RhtB (resistance to homoserine/threonine) family protein
MIDAQILAFTGIAALLTITPGSDTMLVIRSVLARGQRAGFRSVLGICCGLFVHAALSALGLSAILVQSATAFEIVKLAGAAYLIVLGLQSVDKAWRGQVLSRREEPPGPARPRRAFMEGLLNNVLNPKVAVFYLAFLPQFIDPGDRVLAKSLLLATIHFGQGVLWLSFVTVSMERLRRWLTHRPVQRALETVTGVILVAFGVRLAFETR